MEVRILGSLEVVADGGPVAVRGAKQRTLLALLAVHRGEPVPTERLIDLLWGDSPPSNPGNALQAQVSQLRAAATGFLAGLPGG